MKKAYVKPEVAFFDFTLNTSIAANCEEKTRLPQIDACGWKPDARWEGTIFVDASTGCDQTPAGSGYDTLCYHVPTEAYNLFTS
jgi:hypothetical protein